MSKIIEPDDFNKIIKNLRAESISPFPFITPDFNFSAKFYAMWLRWLFSNLEAIEIVINQLLKRNLKAVETDSILLSADGDWTTEFVITLNALLKIAKETTEKKIVDYKGATQTFTLLNSLKVYSDGVYSPDYGDILDFLNNEVNEIQGEINVINDEIIDIYNKITNIDNEIIDINNEINTIINIINKLPKGTLNFTSKDVVWTGDGTSGEAASDFTAGTYSIEWTVNNVGFSTDMQLVIDSGNDNITWQTVNDSTANSITTYSCHIKIDGKKFTGSSDNTKVDKSGVVSGVSSKFAVKSISKLVNVTFDLGS